MQKRLNPLIKGFLNIQVMDPAYRRRAYILSAFLGIIFVFTIFILVMNIAVIATKHDQSYSLFVVADTLVLGILIFLYWLARTRYTPQLAAGVMIMQVVMMMVSFPLDALERVLGLCAIPILLASFTISPPSSFGVALISVTGYSLVYVLNSPQESYNYITIPGLFLIALASWMASSNMENALSTAQASEKKYRALIENIPAVTYTTHVDEGYSLIYISPQVQALLGVSQQEYLAEPASWSKTLHPDDHQRVRDELKRSRVSLAPFTCEYRLLARDGRVVWVRDQAAYVCDHAGQPMFFQGVKLDISDLKRAEEQLQASLSEKEVLLREIHHRVKNNLQVMASLLSLQAESIHDPKVLELFQESQGRVRSMALVHDELYRSQSLARIDLFSYVEKLVSNLWHAYAPQAGVTLKLQIDEVFLDVDAAIPCGLIVNELVSNALKYAFPGGRKGEICISAQQEPGTTDSLHYVLSVSDNGVGISQQVDISQVETLGLQLVYLLTRQLQGRLELDRSQGSKFTITFPDPGPGSRQVE